MATEDTIQNLIRLAQLYFRALRSSYAKTTFHINRKELLALGISTIKELKLFDEGSWVAYVSRVKWNQQEAGKAEVFYRTDLLRMAKAGDLEHIPGKAEIDKVYFKTACPLPILSIRERLQELRLDIESDLSADVLAMCKWPGRDVINSINLNAQDPNVLMRINRIEEKHLSCFRMLKRVIQGKQPNKALMAMTVPDEAAEDIEIDSLTKEQQWRNSAPDYMLLSEAIVRFAGGKPALSTLSKKITPDGLIRYMRKGQRCKVHIGDFREYAQKHYPSDTLAGEIADEYMADIEVRKAEEKKHR